MEDFTVGQTKTGYYFHHKPTKKRFYFRNESEFYQRLKEICDSYPELRATYGSGITDYFKGIFRAFQGNRDNLPPSVRDILSKEGNVPVTGLQVARRPLAKTFNTLLETANILDGSSGTRVIPDDLFHLFLIIQLQNGKNWRAEKNETINIIPYTPTKGLEQRLVINPIPPGLTMNNMIERTRKRVGDTAFYNYSSHQYNCQHFTLNMLLASGIPVSNEMYNFIMQDVASMSPEWVKSISYFLTSLKNRIGLITSGYGVQSKSKLDWRNTNIDKLL